MVQIIAKEVNNANVGIKIKVFPNKTLFKPREQWSAMVAGILDISAFPLAYAAPYYPEFNLTLMPGLIKNHEHAVRMNKSEFMRRIKKIMNDAGIVVLADAWLAGGFVSREKCILEPDDIKGKRFRAAGTAFNQMLAGAGAIIASMPSSEIYAALEKKILDGANTSSASLVSFRIYEKVTCLTAPSDNALWFMYEPILMSKKSFEKLTEVQCKAILDASAIAEAYASEKAKEADHVLVETYKNHGVKIVTMTKGEIEKWRRIAERTSYKNFADQVTNGRELLKEALSVE
jgi:TRAP-type C4-dicarboxylate transport system substrate-binding protein